MAKIIDPDQLNQGTEVVISTAGKTIQLLSAGNLSNASPGSTSGVTLQALYSFLKEEWKSDNALNKFKFPIQMFTKTDGQFINGWTFADATSRHLIRDGGWTEGANQYAGIISLGSFNATGDQAYYANVVGYNQTVTNFNKTGNLNEAILITGFTGYLKTFLRIQAKLYGEYDLLSEQNLTVLEPVLYRLPLANTADLKINESDVNIDGNAPYTGMKVNYLKGVGFTTWANATVYPAAAVVKDNITGRWKFTAAGGTSSGTSTANDTGVTDWAAYDGEFQIGTTYYAFNRILTGNSGTAQQIYNWAQRQLRKTGTINANDSTTVNQRSGLTINGNVAASLCSFLGDQLLTGPGLYISGFDTNSTNSITFNDITVDSGGINSTTLLPVVSTARLFPFVATGNLVFSTNLVSEPDADTRYTMYFTTNPGGNFDSSSAIIVDNNSGVDISGQITSGTIAWTFDYDNNVQGGRTAGTNADVTVVAQGLNSAQWVAVTHTITRSVNQTINVSAIDERNYANP